MWTWRLGASAMPCGYTGTCKGRRVSRASPASTSAWPSCATSGKKTACSVSPAPARPVAPMRRRWPSRTRPTWCSAAGCWKPNIPGKPALGYGRALEAFGQEIEKLTGSTRSIREGKFLEALVREELKQDQDWVIKLRSLPDSPETYYLMELMASHDFQESLTNYLRLAELRKKLDSWEANIDAWEEIIARRRAHYQPMR